MSTNETENMTPDKWKKLLKIVIAVLTAIAGTIGVSCAAMHL